MPGLRLFLPLLRNRSGVTAIEYAVIGSLIAVAIVTAVSAVGNTLSGIFTTLATSM